MPAQYPWQVYRFERVLGLAAKDVINYFKTQFGMTAAVDLARDASVDSTPRIELIAAVSSTVPQWAAIGQAHPKMVPVARFYEIRARVVTTRAKTTDETHDNLVGLVRYALSAQAKGFNQTNLPHHQILTQEDVSAFPDVENDDKEQDVTEIGIGGIVAIRNEAWPPTP